MADPFNYAVPLLCYLPNLVVLGQTVLALLRRSASRLSRSLKVIGTDTYRSGTDDFLLTFHSNRGPISYRFRDKRRLQSKIANFPHPCVYFLPPLKGFFLELGNGA